MGLGGQRPTAAVLDGLPYFVEAAPALPSLLQAALAPLRDGVPAQARLLVCGSAVGLMGRLLGGNAPLRGRAGLMLLVQPFPYRVASQFWERRPGPRAPHLRSGRWHAGLPPRVRAQRGPADAAGFDDWVVRAVLDRNRLLLHEGRYLLAEDPDLSRARDRGLNVSALAAVAAGHRTHARIAACLGRRSEDLTYVLAVLEDEGLLVRREDLLRRRRPTYDLADPFLRFPSRGHPAFAVRAGRRQRPASLARRAAGLPCPGAGADARGGLPDLGP